jgi:alkylation response protein AidB-like acyl-CoA dehydrogenase
MRDTLPMPVRERIDAIVSSEVRPRADLTATGSYPAGLLRTLGRAGAFASTGLDWWVYEHKRVEVLRSVARGCLATAFLVWCQTAAVVYLRTGDSEHLRRELLPGLESGEILGGTGLSNAMKAAAGLEPIRIHATPTAQGFRLRGTLPAVSNLGPGHWFGVVAAVTANRHITVFVPTDAPGVQLLPRDRFAGLNGTATYAVRLMDVEVPVRWVLSDDADRWLHTIRPGFLLSQAGMGLGFVDDIVSHIARRIAHGRGTAAWLERVERGRRRGDRMLQELVGGPDWARVVALRRDIGRLVFEAWACAIVTDGSAGFQADGYLSRRGQEAWFYAIVTPSLAQLEHERQRIVGRAR